MKRTLKRATIVKNIAEAERQGDFQRIVDFPNYSRMAKVTGGYRYIRQGIQWKIIETCARCLARFVGFFTNRCGHGLKIDGRNNIAGIQAAIITCNHVDTLDSLMVRSAARGHRLYIAVAELNNKKGCAGLMRWGAGSLPMSTNVKAQIRFHESVAMLLKKHNGILFYPEVSLWHHYPKPRPYRDGAFYYAIVNNVPIVPMFITFSKRNGLGRVFGEDKATIHIMPALYPDVRLDKKAAIAKLKEANQAAIECLIRDLGK